MPLRIVVVGTGYLGATHAAYLAELGFEVLGVDADPMKVAALGQGKVPFFEPGLEELVERHVGAGNLRFTTSYEQAGRFGDVFFLCLGTPQRIDGDGADLSQLVAAVDALAPHLAGPCLLVGKSTVPVGTADRLAERLTRRVPTASGVDIAWNPEFLREGKAVSDSMAPDRLVFGVTSERGEKILREIYARPLSEGVPVVVTDLRTAELAKTAANAFLATKLSFANALADLCERVSADVLPLVEAISRDSRIGSAYLHPGIGFGGGCLGKDLRAFVERARELGVADAVSFLPEIDRINERCRTRLVDVVRQECGGTVHGRTVAALGAAFKPGTDDVRDSAALAIAGALHEEGAKVTVYDPQAQRKAGHSRPELDYADDVAGAVQGADVVLHLTDWPEFAELEPESLADFVAHKRIVDGRNSLDPQRWRESGWSYRAPGRPL